MIIFLFFIFFGLTFILCPLSSFVSKHKKYIYNQFLGNNYQTYLDISNTNLLDLLVCMRDVFVIVSVKHSALINKHFQFNLFFIYLRSQRFLPFIYQQFVIRKYYSNFLNQTSLITHNLMISKNVIEFLIDFQKLLQIYQEFQKYRKVYAR